MSENDFVFGELKFQLAVLSVECEACVHIFYLDKNDSRVGQPSLISMGKIYEDM